MYPRQHREKPNRSGQAGFTAIELLLLVVLLGVVLIKATETYGVGATTQSKLTLQELLQDRLRRSSERMANCLRQAGIDTVQGVPDFPDSSAGIRFRRLENYDLTNGPVWGAEESIAVVTPEGSGISYLMWNPGTGPRTWATGVTDLRFSREGHRIHYVLEASGTSPDGERITVRSRSNVTLQN